MDNSKISLPPGFELESDNKVSLPAGFQLEEPKKKTNWKEDIATSFAGVGNTFDTLGTLAWSIPASENRKDEMYGNLNKRIKQRNQWANPEGKEQDFSGKVIGTVATLPMSMLAMGASPVETGKTFLDQGESLGRAYGAAGLDLAGNIAGMMLPMPGATKLAKGASNAAINAGQEAATRAGISAMAENPETKKIFDPTLENIALAGIVGAGFGVAQKTKPKVKQIPVKPVSDVESIIAGSKPETPIEQPKTIQAPDWRLESDIAANRRVQEDAMRLNTADDFNNRDANVRAVQEEIAAKEAADAQEAMLSQQASEQARLAEVDNWRNNAKQDEIVEDFGNNDPLARMPEMRVDESRMTAARDDMGFMRPVSEPGIPIRADLSMEAANLENPLQRNLWGDELPIETGDGGIPLTQALDSMQRGPDRELAIESLRGYKETSRIKDIENSKGQPTDLSTFEGEGGSLGRSQRGAFDIDAVTEGIAGLRLALGKTNKTLKDKDGNGVIVFRGTNTPEKHNPAEARPGQAVFVSDNPYLSSNYVRDPYEWHMGRKDHGGAGAVFPMVFRPDVKVIEYPVDKRGFDIVGFHERATRLGKNEVLVARNSRDAGPGSWKDPYNRSSYDNDQYAFTDPTVVNSLYNVAREIIPDSYSSSFKQQAKSETEYNIAALKEGGIPSGEYQTYNLKNNGKQYLQQFTENGRRAELERLEKRLRDIREDISVTQKKYSQLGALRSEDIVEGMRKLRERFGGPKDSIRTPISTENIEARKELRTKAQVAGDIIKTKLPEYDDPQTFEEASALSREAKDIKSNPYTRSVASGLNFMATYHNNPLLKYARKLINDARGEATAFSKKYITSDTGIAPAVTKLTADEKILVNDILINLDKHQVDYTPELADKMNLSENVRNYLQAHKTAMDAEWEWRKSVTDSQGVNTARKRSGYSPSVFNGVYNSLVTDGKGKPIGVISADTPGEFMKAKEYYSKTNPEAKFSANTWQQARRSFSGGNHGAFKYRDLGAMIDLLTKADGDFSKVQMQVAKDALQASTDLYNFNVHNMAKKGVTGNIGNKPWLSAKRNAQERLDSVVRFLEEAAEHHALQKPSEELRLLSADDSTSHLPVAKEYLDDYFKNITGSYVNNGGKIINAAFDGVHLGVEAVTSHIPGAKNYIGPGNTLKLSNTLKNKMSQMYMGWFNWMFTVSQLAQPVQTGVPWMQLVANRFDMPASEVQRAMVGSIAKFMRHDLQQLGIVKDLDPRTKEIIKWGQDRGILDFTEMERAYEGHKTKAGRVADNLAEMSMQFGESKTRAPMFLAFVELLSKKEPDLQKVLPVAENLTNQAMADYHRWERPLAYSGLGVLAPHAGGLTTFKHNYMGTQVLLGREAGKPGLGSKVPIALSAMSMLALGGITGVPFYDEMNTLYEEIREKFSGERRSISQDMLKELPQYLKTGVVSSILDLNMQGKFSSANMIPDSLGQAAFPHLTGAGKIVQDAAALAKTPNSTTASNLAQSATPSGWKQATNAAVKKDENWLVDRNGMRDVERTPEQWRNSAITGLTPLDEAVDRNRRFQNRENEKARTDAMKQHAVDFKAAVIAGDDEAIGKLLDKYEELGGNPVTLIKQIPLIQREAAASADERARGIPKSRQGTQRYEAYDN